MAFDIRLRAYAPNGADLGTLPAPEKIAASYVFGDVGGMTLDYGAVAPRSELLGSPLEITVEVATDGLAFTEPPNSRFLYLRDGRDPLRSVADSYAIQGPSYLARLEKARVLPEGQLGADGKRSFITATAGAILRTLCTEAQARGALAGMTFSSFTASKDSAGQPWSQVITIRYSPGVDYLTVLRSLHTAGVVDFTSQGRALHVYNADTAMALDRTVDIPQTLFTDIYPADATDPVVLRRGRDLTEAPFRRTWEGLHNFAFVLGDGGTALGVTNPSAVTPWGRQESFVTASGVNDTGSLSVLAAAELDRGGDARVERTRTLDFAQSPHLPFRDYGLGDYIFSVTDSTIAPERLRVYQITLTEDKGVVAGNVVLNDRFIEAEVAAARRTAGITGGATASAGGVGNPTAVDPGDDGLGPAAPTGLSGSSEAYLDSHGNVQTVVTLTWTIPTTNVDGTAMEDLAFQYVSMRADSPTAPWIQVNRVSSTTSTTQWSPIPPNTWRRFAISASDRSFNDSALSQEFRLLSARDLIAPGQPSMPVCTERLGLVIATWDGLLSNGGGQPTDYFNTEVHASATTSFTPTAATKVDTVYGAAVIPIPGRPLSQATFVKLVSVDRSGNRSIASAAGSTTPLPLVDTAPLARSITETMIALQAISEPLMKDAAISNRVLQSGVVNTTNLTVGAFSESIIRNGSFTDGTIGAVPLGWIKNLIGFGGVVEQIAATGDGTRAVRLSATASLGAKIETGPVIPVRGGDIYSVRLTAWAEVTVMTGFMFTAIDWCNAAGTVLSSSPPVTNVILNSSFNVFEVPVTAPTGAVLANLRMHTPPGASSAVVGSVSMQRGVGTARILDASIIRAKIGSLAVGNAEIDNLAVNDAKVSNLNVGKLVTGILRADMTVSARIKTADVGERTEINSQGLMCFDAAGTRTIHLTGVAGAAYFKGTVEGSLFRTTGTGQRLEIQSAGPAGGRTITFYPAVAGRRAATITSRDSLVNGDAGFRIDAGGFPYHAFANFAKDFVDIGVEDEGDQLFSSYISFQGATNTLYAVNLVCRDQRYFKIDTERTDWINEGLTYARLAHAGEGNFPNVGKGRLERVVFFESGGAGPDFSFGVSQEFPTMGSDIYSQRFVSTNGINGFVYFSDQNAKENIVDADTSGALDTVKATKVRDYTWRRDGRRATGFIAQEVPEELRITLSSDLKLEVEGYGPPQGISLDGMVGVLWAGTAELAAKVDALTLLVEDLKTKKEPTP